ncbi:DUF1840 domain-containing protein [Cupriavidus sp. AU9028]|uniref:DUF1840 domain-containing protein n=1 Tax=Cupriavidus sp. AU9028 TaxID=2871157 RepID=UPI001C94B228|nr:DUF1840 domain-containing protein [Cupriavidus sp. AU9028]MBY4896742.1 DUF1840 domain-containing protein [Cupriavidus sp. AU9028]
MLITFKSRASQDLTMMNDLAVTLLGIVGKTLGERGVITHAELPRAIHRLEAAVADASQAQKVADRTDSADQAQQEDEEEPLHLGQRAYPFLDMLRASLREGADVLWGV